MLDGAVCALVRPRVGLSAGLRPSTRDQVRHQVDAEGAPPPSGICSVGLVKGWCFMGQRGEEGGDV